MLRLDHRIPQSEVDPATAPSARLSLPFHARSKSRQRVVLEDGREAGIFLPRGTVLRGGDQLRGGAEHVLVVAAPELVSRLSCAAAEGFGRACYHLGNRHVPLEIHDNSAAYLADPVLDQMLHQLGLHVEHVLAPFEPEAGAYARGHHSHAGDGHSHEPSAGHSHAAEPAHSHDPPPQDPPREDG